MSAKTKIVVLHMKEVIYTVIFIVLAIVLILLLVYMFGPGKKDKGAQETALYKAGVYTSSIQFEGKTLDVQVVVDEDHINGVSLKNLDESVATMYPLIESSMESISEQVCKNQSADEVSYSEENQYTSTMLLQAVKDALKKAEVDAEK